MDVSRSGTETKKTLTLTGRCGGVAPRGVEGVTERARFQGSCPSSISGVRDCLPDAAKVARKTCLKWLRPDGDQSRPSATQPSSVEDYLIPNPRYLPRCVSTYLPIKELEMLRAYFEPAPV